MSQLIYHMCRQQEWQDALAKGGYDGSSQDLADGFIHFSDASQVVESAARHRAGQAGLVLIAVRPDRLGNALKWEESRRGLKFPHLYGRLDPALVEWVKDLPLDPVSQLHHFPAL